MNLNQTIDLSPVYSMEWCVSFFNYYDNKKLKTFSIRCYNSKNIQCTRTGYTKPDIEVVLLFLK